MESMAYVHYSSPVAGAEFYTVGELRFHQKYPLPSSGIYSVNNVCETLHIVWISS